VHPKSNVGRLLNSTFFQGIDLQSNKKNLNVFSFGDGHGEKISFEEISGF